MRSAHHAIKNRAQSSLNLLFNLTLALPLMLICAISLIATSLKPNVACADPIEELKFEAAKVPKSLKYKGKIVHGKYWLDNLGENYMIFSEITRKRGDRSSSYLYAYHYVKSEEGPYRLMRRVRDKEEKCDFDNLARFIKESVQITDLDRDLVGEITFAYHLGCVSDLSPNRVKLLVLEGGQKYIIRGMTTIQYRTRKEGGERKLDPSLLKAPKQILDHALKMWERYTVSRVDL